MFRRSGSLSLGVVLAFATTPVFAQGQKASPPVPPTTPPTGGVLPPIAGGTETLGASGNIIINGDFENHTGSGCQSNLSNASFNLVMANATAFGSAEEIDVYDDPGGCWGLPAISGATKICLHRQTNGTVDAFAFDLSTPAVVGKTYSLSFWAQAVLDFAGNLGSVQVGLSNSNVTFGTLIFEGFLPNEKVWNQYTLTFVAPMNANFVTVQVGNLDAWEHIDAFSLREAACPDRVYCDTNPNNAADLTVDTCDCNAGSINLMLSGAPAVQCGYPIIGSANGVSIDPPGAVGDLCLIGAAIGRYAGDVMFTDGAGNASLDLLNAVSGGGGGGIPNPPGGNICAPPGQTWNFQWWHRDGMNPSKFSKAISVTFN